MNSKFYGFKKKSEGEIKNIWRESIFVYDTNVLLNLYRYSQKTQKTFLELLQKLKKRSWIPYYVSDEFFKNRLIVIREQEKLYEKIEKSVNFNKVKADLSCYKDRHFSIDIDGIMSLIDEAQNKLTEKLNESRKKDADYINSDIVLEQLFDIFEDRVSKPLSDKDLEEKYKLGRNRYDKKLPPGYMDEKKKVGNEKYNDYIIWDMVMEYSKEKGKPIIFITDDRKEDWWQIYKGETIGPRFELINEFYLKTGNECLMYKPNMFLEYAIQELNFEGEELNNAVKEIENMKPINNIERENTLLTSALDTLEEGYHINMYDIKTSIENIEGFEFTTIDLVKELDDGTYFVGMSINKAVGRVLSEAQESLHIKPIGRVSTIDDNGDQTTTLKWIKLID